MLTMVYNSYRKFKIWGYTVSHSSLLIRSVMKFTDEDGFSEDTSYNIDVEFWSVTYINAPTFLEGIKIIEISKNDLPENINRELCKYNQKVFEIHEGDNKYYIIAGGLLVGINRWEKEDRIFNYDLDLEHDEVIAKS